MPDPIRRKIKITSGGTVPTTKVEDAETGEPIGRVSKITWEIDVEAGMSKATLEFLAVPADLTADEIFEVTTLNDTRRKYVKREAV